MTSKLPGYVVSYVSVPKVCPLEGVNPTRISSSVIAISPTRNRGNCNRTFAPHPKVHCFACLGEKVNDVVLTRIELACFERHGRPKEAFIFACKQAQSKSSENRDST